MLGLGIGISLGNNRLGGSSGLDFASGSLPDDTTFARAGSAYYSDGSASVAADVPRFEDDSLLIEPAATNLLQRSAEFDHATWITSGATVTANAGAAPDGTTTAESVQFTAGADRYVINSSSIPCTADPYSMAIWLKGSVGGEVLYLFGNSGPNQISEQITLTTEWQRYSFTDTPPSDTYYWGLGSLAVAGHPNLAAMTISVWGGQVELGGPTSYIPTTTVPVARASDYLSLTVPDGKTSLTYTFDDDSTQDMPAAPGSYTVPPGALDRPNVKRIAFGSEDLGTFSFLLAEGDSITDGYGANDRGYAQIFIDGWADGNGSVVAVPFATLLAAYDIEAGNSLEARAATVDALIPADKQGRQYVLSLLLGNDFTNGLADASAYAVAVSAYCSARKAAGWDKIILCTILPRTTGGFNTLRNAFNAIVTGGGWAAANNVDVVCDFAGNATMGPDAAASNATYYPDGIHPGALGQTILEPVFAAAVASL